MIPKENEEKETFYSKLKRRLTPEIILILRGREIGWIHDFGFRVG